MTVSLCAGRRRGLRRDPSCLADIFLLHRPGVDREVLSSFLNRHGHRVRAHQDAASLRTALDQETAGDLALLQGAAVNPDER